MRIMKVLMIITVVFLPLSTVNASLESERKDVYDYKEFFDDLFPSEEEESSGYTDACVSGSSSYMWPIGSSDVTTENGVEVAKGDPYPTIITSYFGSTEAGIHDNGHGALDIAPAADAGVVNVIAAQAGEVIVANTGCVSFEGLGSSCGGGYGNYVAIKSNDGNYQYYGHMHQNTLKVKVGDKVVQGQVIGKVGSSGRSTGTHLHFEVREGQDAYGSRVDPLNYVDKDNPRPSSSSEASSSSDNSSDNCEMPEIFITFIKTMEGGYEEGDNYIAYDGGDGVSWTIGPGLTPYAKEAFDEAGVDMSKIYPGARVKKSEIDKVFVVLLQRIRRSIEERLASNNITMNNNQILALVSFEHNGGGTASNNVISSYKENGNTYKVFNKFCEYVHGEYQGVPYTYPGLIKRRKAEWLIWSSGIYLETDDTQSSDNTVECIGNFAVPNDKKSMVSPLLEETAKQFSGNISYY